MVQLDHQLIFQARRLTTGANVHTVNTLLFQYQQTVALHNAGHIQHRVYSDEFEKTLRAWIASAQQATCVQ
jgi:hypothetical protein